MVEDARGAGSSSAIPVWVALIAAIVSVAGYLIGYYKDLAIQERRERQEFILELLREDALESTKNLLWADKAGLISLSEQARTALSEDPASAPTRTETVSGQRNETVSLGFADLGALVSGLNSQEYSTRYSALESLERFQTANENAVNLALDMLSDSEIDMLSANGRYNVLYFLDRVAWNAMGAETVSKAQTALQTIKTRQREGITEVGTKTQALLDSIRQKIGAQ
jgi:hypothetical protein